MNNRELLINVCREIKPLLDQFVLVGGCSTELLITDSAAPHPRPTQDVDMVVNAITLHDYYHVEAELRELGFSQTMDEHGIICRWEKGILKLDVMPIDEKILGFTNRWYRHAVDNAITTHLDDITINHVTAAVFIATKLDAFSSRGKGDFMMSHDLEDLISVIDGRNSIIEDIKSSPIDVQEYIKSEIKIFLTSSDFDEALPGLLPPDQAGQARLEMLLKKLKLFHCYK